MRSRALTDRGRLFVLAGVCFALGLFPLGGVPAAVLCVLACVWIPVPGGAGWLVAFAAAGASGAVAAYGHWAWRYREFGAPFWNPEAPAMAMMFSSLQVLAVALVVGGLVLLGRYLWGRGTPVP